MNKNIVVLLIILALAVGAYFLFQTDEEKMNDTAEEMVICDEEGNRYSSAAEAEAAGLSPAQYGATYCPEYVAAQTGDYTGLTVAQAEEIAEAREEMFRVVEIDGEPQPTTRDFRVGRINATVEGGVITSYTIESMQAEQGDESDTNDEIIGMTTAEAEAYAAENEVDFRVGMLDGESLPVTLDYRIGRITAEVENDVVVGYTVE